MTDCHHMKSDRWTLIQQLGVRPVFKVCFATLWLTSVFSFKAQSCFAISMWPCCGANRNNFNKIFVIEASGNSTTLFPYSPMSFLQHKVRVACIFKKWSCQKKESSKNNEKSLELFLFGSVKRTQGSTHDGAVGGGQGNLWYMGWRPRFLSSF